MGRYQLSSADVIVDGTGAPVNVPTPLLPGDAQAFVALPAGQTVAVTDRIGLDADPGAAQMILDPPAQPMPSVAYVAGRYLHSLPAGARAAVGKVTIPAGAPGTVSFTHGLGAIPDFIAATPAEAVDGCDWAVTAYDDTTIDFANWDAGNDLDVNVYAALPHSIDTPIDTSGPIPATLNGGGPAVAVEHLLTRAPDFISVFPWAPGLVQPAGMAVLTAFPTDTEVELHANHAAGLLDVLCFFQATHSIQA